MWLPLWVRARRTSELVVMLAPRELRLRYRQSILDVLWALINPVVVLVVYGLILTQSFDVTGSCSPYLTSAWTGLVAWTFFATAVGTAVTSLIASSDLVTKVYFPREALPLSATGASLADLAIGMVTVFVIGAVQGVGFTPAALGAIVPLVVLTVWAAAIGVFMSVFAVFARDVVHGVHLILRVGFFATPVMFGAEFLPSGLGWTATYSPVAASITELRNTALCGAAPDLGLMLPHLAVGGALLVAGIAYTASVESRLADVL